MSTPRVIKEKHRIGNRIFTGRQRLRCRLNAATTASRNRKVQPSLPKLKFMESSEQGDKL